MDNVCTTVDVDQFSAGKSQEKCGFYAVSLLKYAGKPRQSPSGSGSQVAAWADQEYMKYDGVDIFDNSNGMTVPMLYAVIADAGLHFQAIGATETNFHPERLTADHVRAWLRLGYPVVLSVAEDDVYDLDIGAKPYAWNTTNLFHVIVATNFDGNTLLCHDTASVDGNGVRPGPRRYDASRLQQGMISATAVAMPWLVRPIDGYDALEGEPIMPIPQGWHDDGAKLIAPNGHYFTWGIRDYVRNATSWDPNNQPLEEETHADPVELHNPTGGAGQRQCCRDTVILSLPVRGIVQSAGGAEVRACLDKIATLETQIAALEVQLAAKTSPLPVDRVAATIAIDAIGAGALGIASAVATLKSELHIP
jgi:hypothetical protein